MSQAIDIRDAFFDELYRIAQEDPEVVFMTADMGAFSLERFRADFPERFINVGISEQNLISAAAGMALAGKRVFVYAIIPFVTLRCLEQIKVDLCVMNLPVTVIGAGAGFTYSSDGPTHHAIEDVAVMRAFPNLTIYNPGDQVTASAAARSAYLATGPVYVRLDKGTWPRLYENADEFPRGCSKLRSGSQVLIVATGSMTHSALDVANRVQGSGISAAVVDLYRLKPIPPELVEYAREASLVVTLEEHNLPGGMGGAVAELFTDHGLLRPMVRLGVGDTYTASYGDRDWLLQEFGLSPDSVARRIVKEVHDASCQALELPVRRRTEPGQARRLDLPAFSRLLGVPEQEFSPGIRAFIEKTDFGYQVIEREERERLLLHILNTIDSGKLSVSGPGKQVNWERGWGENLQEFEESGHNLETLLPKFVRKGQVVRLQGEFILPANPDFETAMVTVLRDVLFRRYFPGVRRIAEFGCGTGLNLLHLSRLFPDKALCGLDWAQASCDIVNRLAATQRINLKGVRFDMYAPDPSFDLDEGDGVFTIGALEQLGGGFGPFLSFLCERSPAICIHFETMNELYSDSSLSDHLIKRYSGARNYLDGFLSSLKALEQEGAAQILQVQRTFGSLYHEGYSFVAWRPLRRAGDGNRG